MESNQITKGMRVKLTNGWEAKIEDNQKRGRTRMATVYGFCTEMGSVYTHDIIAVRNSDSGIWETVEHTPQQKKLRSDVKKFFA